MAAPKRKTGAGARTNRMFIGLLALLALCISASVLIFAYLATARDHDEQYFNLVDEQEILSERISQFAREAIRGKPSEFVGAGPFLQLQDSRLWFQDTLEVLKKGDPFIGLPPAPSGAQEEVRQVEEVWTGIDEQIQVVLDAEEFVPAARRFANELDNILPDMAQRLQAIAGSSRGTDLRDQLLLQQAVRVQRIGNDIDTLIKGGTNGEAAASRLDDDLGRLGGMLTALRQGDRSRGIGPPRSAGERQALDELLASYERVQDRAGFVAEHSAQLIDAHQAADAVASEPLLDAVALEDRAFRSVVENRPVKPLYGTILGAIALVLLIAAIYMMTSQIRQLLTSAREQNRRNQEAILQLLDEMGTLAEGDLTVQATVTEDITGAIADSINYAIEALRDLVTTINNTAERVARAAAESQDTATRLIEASEHQTQQINAASTAIDNMARSIGQVSENAQRSAKVAQQSVQIAAKGGTAVRRTIEGMDSIREQIQETSKRIKRLGESSQEIGNIVELINDIAEQTNILALNAAIQASSAGEQGRGFAVVADEVQRLAERSTNATKQIEALVRTIQADTNEAVSSMENSTSGVVQGAKLAEDAGNSLDEIERVSNQIASLVQSISDAARQQTMQASEVATNMTQIQDITVQTAEGTRATGESIGRLAELATELRESVSGFKLP